MPQTEVANFQRDTDAGASLAARFGSGVGTAEQLIEANSLRFSEELIAANSLQPDRKATEELDRSEVAEAVGVSEKLLLDYKVRGDHVTFVAADSTGRVYKGVLNADDLSLVEEAGDNPARARIQAQAAAARIVQEAEAEAKRIREQAEAEASAKVAEAAQKGAEQVSETVSESVGDQPNDGAPADGSAGSSGDDSGARQEPEPDDDEVSDEEAEAAKPQSRSARKRSKS